MCTSFEGNDGLLLVDFTMKQYRSGQLLYSFVTKRGDHFCPSLAITYVILTLHHLGAHALYKLGKLIDGGKVGEPGTSEQCEYLQRLSGPAWQPFDNEVSQDR
jgi:hypothetical protein